MGLSAGRSRAGDARDGRPGGVQGDPGIHHVHPGFWVRSDRGAQRLDEPRPEVPQLAEAGPELRMDRRLGNRRRLGQRMEPPRQPDVDVQRHGAVSQLANRGLLKRHGVTPERFPEDLVQDDAFLP